MDDSKSTKKMISKIFVASFRGMFGSAILRAFARRRHNPALAVIRASDVLGATQPHPVHARQRMHDIFFLAHQTAGAISRVMWRYGRCGGWMQLDDECIDIRAWTRSIGGYSTHADKHDTLSSTRGTQKMLMGIGLIHRKRDTWKTMKTETQTRRRSNGHSLEVAIAA